MYQKPLTENAIRILQEGIRLDLIQEKEKPTLEQAIQNINQMAQKGSMAVIVIDNVVFTLNRVTPFLGNLHLAIARNIKMKEVIDTCRQFAEWIWKNTQYNRIETRSPLKFTKVIGDATHGDVDLLKASFFDGEKMLDEYLVGWIRPKGG